MNRPEKPRATPDAVDAPAATISPSAFMRELRPENYSDSESHVSYRLDQPTFEYHLESLTARNETHDFELFCRKLCERTICPNLRPATGPEGGGDSKADTETYPVADEIAIRAYEGQANGDERWAFAYSAKARWADKARSDVKGLVETGRGYQRIIVVTSQFARDKERAKVEDELTETHGVKVTILDRSWIVEEIIAKERLDLAYNFLGVGEPVTSVDPGPNDYSRARQLEDIERALDDPEAYGGFKMQAAMEALVAAKLSRALERPRHETEGRFLRAVRLADAHGIERQKYEARYEQLWTSVWWFDEAEPVHQGYDAFESLVIETEHARNLEFLTNLLQALYNAVHAGKASAEHFDLAARTARLVKRLEAMAADSQRPTNQLEARINLLVVRGRAAMHAMDLKAIAVLWPEYSEVLTAAHGLTEFDATRFVRLVEVVGPMAGDDPAYTELVERTATFVAERTSQGAGALVLLKRARQLGDEAHFEKIRLLGRAVPRLAKKEHLPALAEGSRLLAEAYSHAGLLWAARAACLFAAAALAMQSDEDNEVPIDLIGVTFLFVLTALELHHLPDVLTGVDLLQACANVLPLTEESQVHLKDNLRTLDHMCAGAILNLDGAALESLGSLPDALEPRGLFMSRAALLYAMGYGEELRQDGTIPPDAPTGQVEAMFAQLAEHTLPAPQGRTLYLNSASRHALQTTVMGVRVAVSVSGSETAILVAEAVLGSVEAFAATAIDLRFVPHVEAFEISVVEMDGLSAPHVGVGPDGLSAIIHWPSGVAPAALTRESEAGRALHEVAALTLAMTCTVKDFDATLEKLHADERVHERLSMIGGNANAYHRVFGRSLSRLADWNLEGARIYDLQPGRPATGSPDRPQDGQALPDDDPRPFTGVTDHRQISVRSVVDIRLWNEAGWDGIAYLADAWDRPPTLAFLFANQAAAERIFQRWRERFGEVDQGDAIYLAIIREIMPGNPYSYRVMVTSRPTPGDLMSIYTSRYHTMEPTSSQGLDGFLDLYRRAGAYDIAPAIRRPGGGFGLGGHLAIRKQALNLIKAADVTETDMEFVALPGRRGQEED